MSHKIVSRDIFFSSEEQTILWAICIKFKIIKKKEGIRYSRALEKIT